MQLLIDCLGLHHHHHKNVTGDDRPVVFVGPHEHHSNLLPWRESGCEIVMVPEKITTDGTGSGSGGVDLHQLELLLQKYNDRSWKLGTFTAASNVTGIVSNDNDICALLHKYGALACFDYATAAPYTPINMNPTLPPTSDKYTSPSMIAKDVIFYSPHKVLGGIGTPGVLIIKKRLVNQTNPPNKSGGGTVFYVTQNSHRFLSNRIERYEGGTPNVIGIMRIGLSCVLKRSIEYEYNKLVVASEAGAAGEEKKNKDSSTNDYISSVLYPPNDVLPKTLIEYEYQTHYRVSKILSETVPNLVLLGVNYDDNSHGDGLNHQQRQQRHLPIFSFLIKCGRRFLHYNFVCAILNDIFGIQSRGGCQCAGPYSQRLLGLTTTAIKKAKENVAEESEEYPNEYNEKIEHALIHSKERAELLRPGYTRLSLPFKGLHDDEVVYVIHALQWTAKNAWKLLCHYRCSHRTGEWRHKSRQGAPLGKTERKWLSHYNLLDSNNKKNGKDACEVEASSHAEGKAGNQRNLLLERTLQHADAILDAATSDQSSIVQTMKLNEGGDDDEQFEKLRWYAYPKDVASYVAQGIDEVPGTIDRDNLLGPIRPISWFGHETVVSEVAGDRTKVTSGDTNNMGDGNAPAQAPEATATSSLSDSGTKIPPAMSGSNVYSFRDGEHAGEAPLEEIEDGYDDGELSEECQVFDPIADNWMSIKTFLKNLAQSKESKDEGMKVLGSDIIDDEAGVDAGELAPQLQPQFNTIPRENEIAPAQLDEKNQKKKPSRDRSAWGQGTFTPLEATMPVAVASVPTTNQVDESSSVHDESTKDSNRQGKKNKSKHVKPPPKLMRLVTQAMIQWDMIEEGDRLLLGLSGGKDSLSLLHILLEFQKKLPIRFDIEVCTIDPMTPSFDPSSLIPYVESLGVKYHYIRDNIVERATNAGKDGNMVSSLCAFCARMKRGNLYTCARNNNCNKLVLAQHLDDLAESFMMSVMHNGFLRTMKANYKINAGDLSVIRPLVYCRESLTTEFAKSANLPIVNENCPACFEEPKERARIKKLLTREETLYPNFYDNIRRSLLPLMHDDATAILHCYTEEAVAKSRKENKVKIRPNRGAPQNGKKAKGGSVEDTSQSTVINTGNEADASNEKARDASDNTSDSVLLVDASEEELVRELARRKAERFRLAGSMKRLDDTGDPTGQVCSLRGGDGCIPCRELME